MTVLGKILVFVVLVLSLLWTFLTASTFAARTNWQAQSKRYQEEAQKAGQSATAMKALLDVERETSDDRVQVFKADRDRYEAQVKQIAEERNKLVAEYAALLATNKQIAAEQQPLLGDRQRLRAEVDLQDAQIKEKDKRINELVFSEQAAVVKAGEQANVAKAKTDQANRLTEQVQSLQEALESIKRAGGGRPVPGGLGVVRVPAPEGFRGTVLSAQPSGGQLLVTINQGADAGLRENTELTIRRLSGGGQYLGRLLVTRSDPKQAVGRFVPPTGQRPTAADSPRPGDEVVGSSN